MDTSDRKVKEKYYLYGLKQLCVLAIKAFSRKVLRLDWDTHLLMSRYLDSFIAISRRDDISVREIDFADFQNDAWESFMTPSKVAFYKNLKNKVEFNTYGAFLNGKLAYTTNIVWDKILLSDNANIKVEGRFGFLMDSYCHPDYRGKGIHNYMNQWCLTKIKEAGRNKAYVSVLAYNVPAIKTQKKCGLEIEQRIRVIRWGKYAWVKIIK